MLATIQIIALLQGVFLLVVITIRREQYKRIEFRLLTGCIVSVMLYAIGDDDFNLFVEDANWFFFYDSLIITFFYLLVKYHITKKSVFSNTDWLFFVPHLLFVGVQFLNEFVAIEGTAGMFLFDGFITITFLSFLGMTIARIVKSMENRWMLFFILPYFLVFLLDRGSNLVTNSYDSLPFLESYGVIGLSVFLFYIILFKLVIAPKTILTQPELSAYKTSGLNSDMIEVYKNQLEKIMEEERVFTSSRVTVNDVAGKMDIPRQYLSELLNVHMKTSFQALVNQYRVNEFIRLLEEGEHINYSLLGIAYKAGFSSKASFYTTFKKLKGMTPNTYKEQFLSDDYPKSP